MSFPALPQAARPPAPASKPLPGYLALVGVPLLAIAAALALLHADGAAAAARTAAVENGLLAHLAQPLPRFLLQLLVVLGAAKFAGWLARKAGQPAVIGEMLAGIVLGPSLFGWLLPTAQAWLFPAGGIGPLTGLSQLGVLLFMFAAGAEF